MSKIKIFLIGLSAAALAGLLYFLFAVNACDNCADRYEDSLWTKMAGSKLASAPVLDGKDQVDKKIEIQNDTITLGPEILDEEVKKWVAQEAPALNSTNVNTPEKDVQLKAQAQELTHGQRQVFLKISQDPKAKANERILATYVLSLNLGEGSHDDLATIAKKEVPQTEPIVPHTEGEIKNSQELAIRYMAIDELAERAQTDSSAFSHLKSISIEAGTESVRNYARRKLEEISK